MAYLFAANGHAIPCGTIAGAATFSVFARFSTTIGADVVNERALATLVSDPRTLWGMYLIVGVSASEVPITLGFSHTSGATFPEVTWGTSGFTAGSIHTVVATYDGSNMRVYADTDATAKATAAQTNTPDTGTLNFCLGNYDGGTATSSLDGTLYEVGWWPGTVLSGAEAAAIGAGSAPATPPAHYWPLVTNANDFVGTNHGTPDGATLVAHSGTNLYGAVAPTRRSLTLLGVS